MNTILIDIIVIFIFIFSIALSYSLIDKQTISMRETYKGEIIDDKCRNILGSITAAPFFQYSINGGFIMGLIVFVLSKLIFYNTNIHPKYTYIFTILSVSFSIFFIYKLHNSWQARTIGERVYKNNTQAFNI